MSSNSPWILVVDDDESFRELLETFISEKIGVPIVTTSNAADFIAKLKSRFPTLCLIDLNLAGVISGTPLIKSLRNRYGKELPILAISSLSDQKTIIEAIDMGADDYILKPTDRSILEAKISNYISFNKDQGQRSKFIKAPFKGVPINLLFEMDVVSVDEMGLNLLTPHFMTKGMPFNIENFMQEEGFPLGKKVLSTVTDCVPCEKSGQYKVRVEYDELDASKQIALRKFLLHAKEERQ